MRAGSILVAAALAVAFAAAPARGHEPCECGSGGRPDERGSEEEREDPDVAARPGGNVVASVELGIGLDDRVQLLDATGETPVLADYQAESAVAVTPVVEWGVGRSVFIGGGLRIVQTEESSAGFPVRRSLMNPIVRLRLSFPVYGRLSADALFDAGLAFWSSAGQRTQAGWSQSAAAGPAVRLTDRLATFANIGFYGASARASAADQRVQNPALAIGPEPTELRSLQLTVGVRTTF